MAAPAEVQTSRRADAIRFLAAAAMVAVSLTGLVVLLSLQVLRPYSTVVDFVDEPATWPAADPGQWRRDANTAAPVIRLGFVGDIMQHQAQAGSDFHASYARVRPLIESFDLAVGNLEFPVDPARPVGPPVRSVRFNGSPEHLDALAASGFDVLSTSNNHAFDQGLDGVAATLDALAERGLIAVGTGETGTADALKLVEVAGLRIGFAAYTISPNTYDDADGEVEYWARDWPVHELNFNDWTDDYRDEGVGLFDAHVRRSEAEEVDLLIALVHWGEEWHFQPNPGQRRAARDLIDAGFDLVVGGHSHVLNPPELYRGRLIAYSLGDFISDFAEMETRTGAVLAITIGMDPSGEAEVTDFAYIPVLTERDGHVVTPLGTDLTGDQMDAWALAQRIVGPAVAPFRDSPEHIVVWRGPSTELEVDPGDVGD